MRDIMLMTHFIGLAMALGTGFANMFLGIAAAKMEPVERGQFLSKTMILVRMGHTGLGLLLISGFYLITPFWKVLGDMPTLIAKLVCIGLLIIMISVITILVKKAQRENNPALLAKLKPIGMINLFLAITIVVLAVLTFH